MLHQSQWQRPIKQIASHAGVDVRKEEHLFTDNRSANVCDYENQCGGLWGNCQLMYSKNSLYHQWAYNKRTLHHARDNCSSMFIAILLQIAEIGNNLYVHQLMFR